MIKEREDVMKTRRFVELLDLLTAVARSKPSVLSYQLMSHRTKLDVLKEAIYGCSGALSL